MWDKATTEKACSKVWVYRQVTLIAASIALFATLRSLYAVFEQLSDFEIKETKCSLVYHSCWIDAGSGKFDREEIHIRPF